MTTTTTATTTFATTPFRPHDALEDNPIGLDKDAASKIVGKLDAHVASMFVQFHMYQKHHWMVEGPQFRDLHEYFEHSYQATHAALDAIAERMTALGAIPTCSPTRQAELSYVESEPEGMFRIREMVARDLAGECAIATSLRQTIELCTKLGDYGTETLLKETLVKVEDRAHHLEQFLGRDSLEIDLEG